MVNVDRNPGSTYSGIQLFTDGAKNGICDMCYIVLHLFVIFPLSTNVHRETGRTVVFGK